MYQLGLFGGDLLIGTDGSYVTLTGTDRIRQDLNLALNDYLGTDRFHPGWGSIVTDYIGQVNTGAVQALVKAEVNRVLQNYLLLQQQGVIQQSLTNLTGVYSTADVVRSVDDIDVQATMDTILITVRLSTLAGQTITLRRVVTPGA